jgi:hypothetical protein
MMSRTGGPSVGLEILKRIIKDLVQINFFSLKLGHWNHIWGRKEENKINKHL